MCIHHAQGSESPLKVADSELEHTEQLHGQFGARFENVLWMFDDCNTLRPTELKLTTATVFG